MIQDTIQIEIFNSMTPEDASSGVFKYLNAGLTGNLMGEFINKAR